MPTLIEKIREKFPTLPAIVQYGLESSVFPKIVDQLLETYELKGKSKEVDEIIWELFFKEITPAQLPVVCAQRLGMPSDKASALSRDIVGKLLLVFPEHFSDIQEILKKIGGDLESYYQESELFSALVDILKKEMEKPEPPEFQVDYDQEAAELRNLIETSVLDVVRGDDELKENLNDTAIFLMSTREGYADLLANDLLLNKQQLGASKLVREGKEFTQTVEQWLRDVIATVGIEHMTTITLAKYAAENQNAKKLDTQEKELLRSVFEMYRVLSTYPEGFSKLPREEWRVIPFKRKEKEIGHNNTTVKVSQVANTVALDESRIPANGANTNHESGIAMPAKKELSTQPLIAKESMIPSLPSTNYSSLVEEVIRISNLGEMDEETKRRLQNIILTRVKNVRTSVETREKLITPKDKGGTGFTDEQAENILKSAEQVLNGKTSHQRLVKEAKEEAPSETERVEMMKKIDGGEAPINLPTAESSVAKTMASEGSPKLSIEEIDGMPTLIEKPHSTSTSSSDASPKGGSTERRIPIAVRSAPQQSAKQAMVDVQGPRLVDPIEELRIMSLKDFRRLSPDPMEAVKRIHQKIQMLEKESFTKKQAAIHAWHESEINKLYMEIGKESFGKGLDIQQVIVKQQAEGKQTLSAQEFDALVELNEMIRF